MGCVGGEVDFANKRRKTEWSGKKGGRSKLASTIPKRQTLTLMASKGNISGKKVVGGEVKTGGGHVVGSRRIRDLGRLCS